MVGFLIESQSYKQNYHSSQTDLRYCFWPEMTQKPHAHIYKIALLLL